MTGGPRPNPLALTGALCLALFGCAQSRITDPPRTATEQFLLSKAASNAVNQLSFDVLRGRSVYVETQYFAASEQAFVLGELRARLLLSGVQVTRKPEDAQIIMEVRSSGVGIDRNDYLLGVPSLQTGGGDVLGSSSNTFIPLLTPELAIVKNREQLGVAGVSYVAYWAQTGEVVAASGPFIGRSLRDDWWFFGFGPRSRGNIAPIERER